ncbi:MAG TPA: hypothetical protein VM261_07330 [Kofleriaceae bacterium]|nr:hypothetical protein [Kofleriaceae bacterium]
MSEGNGGKVAVAAGGGILAAFAGLADDCGRAAVRSGDDLARVGAHSGDDFARAGVHGGDDLARAGAHTSDDVARAGVVAGESGVYGERAVEGAARATPRELGFQPTVARQAERFRSTAPGARPDRYAAGHRSRFVALPDMAPSPASSFADDLTRATLEAAIDPATAADLLDGFLTVQEMAEDADDGQMVDISDEVELTADEMTREIEAHLATLSPQARLAVERQLGPPAVIAYRLAEGRPLRRSE